MEQRIEVVDDASWVMGFLDIIDPALDRIKTLLNLERNCYRKEPSQYSPGSNENTAEEASINPNSGSYAGIDLEPTAGFDLNDFIRKKLSLDPDKLDSVLETSKTLVPRRIRSPRRIFRPEKKTRATFT